MGISSTVNRPSPFAGDGSSTVFAFPYYFFSVNDLSVYLYDVNSSIVTPQTINTHYTVSGNANAQGVYPSGGNVVMNSAFPSSFQLIITRNPSQIQNYALNQNGPINSLALVQQLDYLTTLVQRLQDEVSRCIQIPDGLGNGNNGSMNMTLPQSILNNSSAYAPLIMNSAANGWQFGVVATGNSGATSYAGILPVQNGGTGQGGGLTPFGAVYAASGSSMAVTGVGTPGQVLTAGSGAPYWSFVSLNSSDIGVLAVPQGGTGTGTSYIQYGVLFASSATQFASTGVGALNQVLVAQGSSSPIWGTLTATTITGILPVGTGGTGTATSYIQNGVLFASSATQFASTGSANSSVLVTNALGLPALSSSLPAPLGINMTPGTGSLSILANGTNLDSAFSLTSKTGGKKWDFYPETNGFFYMINEGQAFYVLVVSNAGNIAFGGSGTPQSGVSVTVLQPTDQVQLAVKGHSTQTHDLQEWQNTSGAVLAKVNQTGDFTVNTLITSSAPVAIAYGGTAGSSAVQALTNLWPAGITRGDILVVNSGALVTRLAAGSDNQVLTANSSASNATGLVYQAVSAVNTQTVVSKTANYQMTSSDDFVIVSSSLFTVTLPDATTATKKNYTITKTENTLLAVPNQIILSGSGAQTIGSFGNSVNLLTVNETWTVFPDGANWQLHDHVSQTTEVNAGAVTITGTTTNPTKGSITRDAFIYWRTGKFLNFRYELVQGTGVAGSGDYTLALPISGNFDSSNLVYNSTAIGAAYPLTGTVFGNGFMNQQTGATRLSVMPYPATSTSFRLICLGGGVWSSSVDQLSDAMNLTILGQIPMTGWQP